ncbi:MAG: hypothetical protein H7Z14_04295, partial [Anaerolineae bacterium]|nr:hypothetical protein [Phycisphaerae bacterium]
MGQFQHRAGAARTGILVIALVVIGAIAATIYYVRRTPPAAPAVSAPITAPSTAPIVPMGNPAAAPASYMNLVRVAHPNFPTTQPLEIPLGSLGDAARLVFNDPVHLDTTGQLWITRSDGPSVASLLQQAWSRTEAKRKSGGRKPKHPPKNSEPEYDEQTHITRDRVVFAYLTFNEMGEPQQQVVIRNTDGRFELVNL